MADYIEQRDFEPTRASSDSGDVVSLRRYHESMGLFLRGDRTYEEHLIETGIIPRPEVQRA